MVEVGVFQEVVSVQVVEGEGEERGRDQPQPRGGHLQQGPPPRPAGQGQVEGQAVDDRVDLHVDSQPGPIRMYTICIEPRARHMKNLFIESVQCS